MCSVSRAPAKELIYRGKDGKLPSFPGTGLILKHGESKNIVISCWFNGMFLKMSGIGCMRGVQEMGNRQRRQFAVQLDC